MAIALYKAKLSEKTPLGDKFFFLKFELLDPHHLEFLAGQYILLNLPSTPQKRQYSIVSAPRLDHGVELLFEYIEGGLASEYIKSLKEGDEVSFYAPAGEFYVKEPAASSDTPLVFIGTGSGLAPLRSMVLDLLRTKETKRPIQLYWGMRYAQDLFWLDYWQELHDTYPNFSFHVVLSKPVDEWKLCKGRVTDCLAIHELPENADYYICGNQRMIADVIDVLKQRGVDETKLHHEKFS